MIYLQTTITVTGLLAGWMVGLTAHARYATGWRDPAARAAWQTVTALVVFGCLLVALILILIGGNHLSWALLFGGIAAGGWSGWRAAERASLPMPAEGGDYDGGDV